MSDLPEDAFVPEPSLKKRAAKGAVWISFEMAGIQAASFVVFAVMAHYIGPRDFGLISISFLAIQTLQMLVLYNISTVTARKQSASDLEYTTVFWITLGVAATAFIILLGSAGWMETLFKAEGLAPVLRAMSVIILFMGLSRTHETWLMRHFDFRSLAIRGIVGAMVGGAVGIYMAVNGYGVMSLVGQQIATSVVSLILLWTVCPWRPGFAFSRSVAAEIFSFLRRITANNLVYAVNQNCDTFLVAYFLGPVNAGVFNVGKRVRLTLQLVAGDPIKGVALPTLAEIQHDPERLRRGVLRSLALICAVCSPLFFGASAVAPEAISVIFGQKWIEAVPVLQWLAFGGFAMVLLTYNDNIFILKDRPGWSLYGSAAYAVLAVLAFLVCRQLNISSLALPFVLPYLIVFPLSATLAARQLAITAFDWIKAMLPGIGSAAIMFIAVRLAGHCLPQGSDLVRLLVLCAAGGVTYLVVIFAFWRETALMVLDIGRHMLHRA